MSFDEYVDWLEPRADKPGALCMSSSDFARLKSALEIACEKLRGKCVKEKLDEAVQRVAELEKKTLLKAKPKRK